MFAPLKYLVKRNPTPPETYSEFKVDHSYETRKQESTRVIAKNPNKVPIILEKSYSSDVPDIDKHKYLMPQDATVAQFLYIVRERINTKNKDTVDATKAIILFVGSHVPSMNENMKDLYNRYKDQDGFLYVSYAAEVTYG